MIRDQPTSRKPVFIGFAAGAACILLAGLFFFGPLRSQLPATDAPQPTSATPVPSAAGEGITATTTTNPHSFPASRTEKPGPPILAGTIRLDPSITKDPNAAITVFLIARTGSSGKERTVLARRMDLSAFPAPFSLSSADTMAGDEKLTAVSLEARIDMDGDAMTREPGSPTALLPSVQIGDLNVVLTLRGQ
jgi:hypothetical protein